MPLSTDPPKSQAADDIALFEEIRSVIQNNHAVITGDFNCLSIGWTSMNGDREGIEMAEDAFLTQTLIQPTRENNILDFVFASDPDLIRDLVVGEKLGGCDHRLIRFNVRTKSHSPTTKLKYPTTNRLTSIVHAS